MTVAAAVRLVKAAALQASPDAQPEAPGLVLLDATGRVAATGPAALALGGDVPTVEYPGAVLFPGLIDCHTHLVMEGDGAPGESLVGLDALEAEHRTIRNARRALEAGVTTLKDNGGPVEAVLGAARRASSSIPGSWPRLLVSGSPLTVPRGHCWYMGGEVDGAAEARAKATELVDSGASSLKLIASGGGTAGTVEHLPSLSFAAMRAAVDIAHEANVRVSAHCSCTVAIERAADAGCDIIDHANFFDSDGVRRFDPRVAEKLAALEIFVDPTLYVTVSRIDRFSARVEAGDQTAAQELSRWRSFYDHKVEDVRRQHASGVPLVAGSDAGWGLNPFGEFVGEIEALERDVGLSAREALAAATSRAAKALGLSDAGVIRVGCVADFLVLAGNPTDDLRVLRRPLAVYRAGCAVTQVPGHCDEASGDPHRSEG